LDWLCLRIKAALGISGVYTEFYAFAKVATPDTEGFQIDLVLDRKDGVINLCEIKFYGGSFIIDKNYAQLLNNRRQHFIEETKTKKQVHITFITNYELVSNEYSRETVDSSLTLQDFF
jgi:uncharacterized protein